MRIKTIKCPYCRTPYQVDLDAIPARLLTVACQICDEIIEVDARKESRVRRRMRVRRAALTVLGLIFLPLLLTLVLWGGNYLLVQRHMDRLLANMAAVTAARDPGAKRPPVIKAHYKGWIRPGVLVIDIRDLPRQTDELQVLALVQRFGGRPWSWLDRVELHCRGQRRFSLAAADFRNLAQESENEALRRFPATLLDARGERAYPVIAAPAGQTAEAAEARRQQGEQFLDSQRRWYRDSLGLPTDQENRAQLLARLATDDGGPALAVFGALRPLVLADDDADQEALLRRLGLDAQRVAPRPAALEPRMGETPREFAQRAAETRVKALARKHPDACVLAVETVAAIDGRILDRPRNPAEALEMLELLNGRVHTVIGVFAARAGQESFGDAAETIIKFDVFPPEILKAYVATGEPLRHPGGYSLTGLGAFLAHRVEGPGALTAGLPARELIQALLQRRLIVPAGSGTAPAIPQTASRP